jgi:hypothetical protein
MKAAGPSVMRKAFDIQGRGGIQKEKLSFQVIPK